MSLEFGLYQGPNLSQQLNLAPQLLQWLRLLQAPTVELQTFIRHELETNPALEMDEAQPEEHEDSAEDVEAIERTAGRLLRRSRWMITTWIRNSSTSRRSTATGARNTAR